MARHVLTKLPEIDPAKGGWFEFNSFMYSECSQKDIQAWTCRKKSKRLPVCEYVGALRYDLR